MEISKQIHDGISTILDKYKDRIIDDAEYQNMINDVDQMLIQFEQKECHDNI